MICLHLIAVLLAIIVPWCSGSIEGFQQICIDPSENVCFNGASEVCLLKMLALSASSDTDAEASCAFYGILEKRSAENLTDDKNLTDLLKNVVLIHNKTFASHEAIEQQTKWGHLLAWVTWYDYTEHVVPLLSDQQNPFVMNFTHVLVMRMPIRYVLYIDKAPKNVSALKTILLVDFELQGSEIPQNIIVPYSFEGQVDITILDDEKLLAKNVIVDIEDFPLAYVDLSTPNLYVSSRNFSRTIDFLPSERNQTIPMRLLGSWQRNEYTTFGHLFADFSDIDRVEQKAIEVKVSQLDISNVRSIRRRAEEKPVTKLAVSKRSGIYPGFTPYFHFACFIFVGFLTIVFVDVIKQLIREKRNKSQVA